MQLESLLDMAANIGTLIEDGLKNVVVSPEDVGVRPAQTSHYRD